MPRLDVLVTKNGLAESRQRAQALILAGKVRVAGETVPSLVLLLVTGMLTEAVGCDLSDTANVAVQRRVVP